MDISDQITYSRSQSICMQSSNEEHGSHLNNATEHLSAERVKQERDIFFTKDSTEQYIKFKHNVPHIELEHLASPEVFLNFSKSNSNDFLMAKNEFINDIKELKELCLEFLTVEEKDSFILEMSSLVRKIEQVASYNTQGKGILRLFRDIRSDVSIIKQILKTLKDKGANCNISFYRTQNLISEIIGVGMGACLNGVANRIIKLKSSLLSLVAGSTTALVQQAKDQFFEITAQEYEKRLVNHGELTDNSVMHIHLIETLKNAVTEEFGFTESKDSYIENSNINIEQKEIFREYMKVVMQPRNIVEFLAENFCRTLVNLIEIHLPNKTKIFTAEGISLDDIPEGFTADIEKYLEDFKQFFGNDNTKLTITILDILEYLDNDKVRINNLDQLKTKFHYAISKTILSSENYQLAIADIPYQEIPLKIVSYGSCYFSVVPTNQIANEGRNFFKNYDSHLSLQLKHITSDLIEYAKLPAAIYQPLIIQALQQTNELQQIIDFFHDHNIRQMLIDSDNIHFKFYLAKLLTNKLEANSKLKNQLIEYIIKNEEVNNKFNVKNSYWIANTTLVEPVLLGLAKKDVMIADYMDHELTIDDILNFNDPDSLKNICETSSEKINKSCSFSKMFAKVINYDKNLVFIQLLRSGLIDNQFSDLLIKLVQKKNIDAIKILLEINKKLPEENKFNLDTADISNTTLLMYAAKLGDNACLNMLIEQGAHINFGNIMGKTALHFASEHGHSSIVKNLIDKGAHLDALSRDYETPLMSAVKTGKKQCIDILLAHKADIDQALHFASMHGYYLILKELINQGADVNSIAPCTATALIFAAQGGHEKCIDILLARNVDIDAQGVYDGNTALHFASMHGYYPIVDKLIKKGANINVISRDGVTPLMHAAGKRNACYIIDILLAKNAYMNAQHVDSGKTALHFALESGCHTTIKKLIKKGADLNIRDRDGMTALMFALKFYCCNSIIKKLIDSGADVNAISNKYETPLISAAKSGNDKCIDILLYKNADINIALHLATFNGYHLIVEKLIDKGADVNIKNNEGYTALHIALERGHYIVAEKLINKGADVNIKNNKDNTALMIASFNNVNDSIIKNLINQNTDINVKNEKGNTALMYAVFQGNESILEQLINKGANVNIKNNKGDTALHIASWKGHHSIVEKLIYKGADVNIKNNEVYTALMYAAQQGGKASMHDDNQIYIKIVEFLLKYTENKEKVLFDLEEKNEFKAMELIRRLNGKRRKLC